MNTFPKKRENVVPKAIQSKKSLTIEYSEVSSYEKILHNLNDSKSKNKTISKRTSIKSSALNHIKHPDYEKEVNFSDCGQSERLESRFSLVFILNNIKRVLRQYASRSFFKLFRRRNKVSSLYPSLKIPEKEFSLEKFDFVNTKVLQTEENLITKCSSEFKEIRLEDFYHNDYVLYLSRLTERIINIQRSKQMNTFFIKLFLTGYSKRKRESIFVDILTKFNQLRNVITKNEFRKIKILPLLFKRWKIVSKRINIAKSDKICKILMKLDFPVKLNEKLIHFRLWRNKSSFTEKLHFLTKVNYRLYDCKLIFLNLMRSFEKAFNRQKEGPFLILCEYSQRMELYEKAILRRKINDVKSLLVGLIENRHLINGKGTEKTGLLFKSIIKFNCNSKTLVKYFKTWSVKVINSYKSDIAISKAIVEEDIMFLAVKYLERMFFTRTLSYFLDWKTAVEMIRLKTEAKIKTDILDKRAFYTRMLRFNSRISQVERLSQIKRRYKLSSMFSIWRFMEKSLESVPTAKQTMALEFLNRGYEKSVITKKKQRERVSWLKRYFTLNQIGTVIRINMLEEMSKIFYKIKMFSRYSKESLTNRKLFITYLHKMINDKHFYHSGQFLRRLKIFSEFKKIDDQKSCKANFLLQIKRFGEKWEEIVKSLRREIFFKIRKKSKPVQFIPQKIENLFLVLKCIMKRATRHNKKLIFSLFRSQYNNSKQRVLIETEEMKLFIPSKKTELEEINAELSKTQHRVAFVVQKAEKCSNCSNYFANDKVINTLQSIDFNNIQAYKSNSISSQLFEIPNSKNINQKTESIADKDFEMPISKDIYRSNKSSLFEKDFRLPTSQDILRNSDQDVTHKNYKRLTKDKEEMMTLKSMESDFESVNKEISVDENVGKEYSAYLITTLRELNKKKEEMGYNYLFKMQGLKFEIQNLVDEIDELVKQRDI